VSSWEREEDNWIIKIVDLWRRFDKQKKEGNFRDG
jgi:hypothetical protein